MANPKITFEFEGKNYTVDIKAYDTNLIKLPNEKLLKVGGWLESCPPQPIEIKEVTNTFIYAEEV